MDNSNLGKKFFFVRACFVLLAFVLLLPLALHSGFYKRTAEELTHDAQRTTHDEGQEIFEVTTDGGQLLEPTGGSGRQTHDDCTVNENSSFEIEIDGEALPMNAECGKQDAELKSHHSVRRAPVLSAEMENPPAVKDKKNKYRNSEFRISKSELEEATEDWQDDAFTGNREQKTLVVIMYHKILNSRKEKYVVTSEQFESDLIELKARGYETVFPSEVIAYCEGRGELPEKPLMITFDDGCYNNHYYGTPILKKHNCKALLNIVGSFSAHTVDTGDHSKPAYSHLTWEQIKEANESGVWEIGNHTFDMHKFKPRYGIKQRKGESSESYKEALTNDVMKLQEIFKEKCGVTPVCFAYPFGAMSPKSAEILTGLGFKMLLNCYEKPTVITKGRPESLKSANRYNRSGNNSTKKFFDTIEQNIAAIKK